MSVCAVCICQPSIENPQHNWGRPPTPILSAPEAICENMCSFQRKGDRCPVRKVNANSALLKLLEHSTKYYSEVLSNLNMNTASLGQHGFWLMEVF